MEIKHYFDPDTFTLTYVVFDPQTKDAVIIDPVLDYDPAAVKTAQNSIKKLLDFVAEKSLKVHYIVETHAHADHLSGGHDLVTEYFPKAKTGVGRRITEVQSTFKKIFNFPDSFKADGSQFGRLFDDNEIIIAGSLKFKVISTPGHTSACVCYLFEDALFTGDALFMPDYGTGRCDFPGGDAKALYHSITQRIYTLPDSTRIFVGHDYMPSGRPMAFTTTVGESKTKNIQLKASTSEPDFIAFRTGRDATLSAPRLLFPSVQVNIAAGEFPAPESNGRIYLKMPVTIKKG